MLIGFNIQFLPYPRATKTKKRHPRTHAYTFMNTPNTYSDKYKKMTNTNTKVFFLTFFF